MSVKIKQITIPEDTRVVCISDIHGSLELFKRLLDKVNYADKDILILLGDIYTKGNQNHETLKYIISMCQNPNVYVIRGNCDWEEEYLSDSEKEWLNGLPHIIESQNYIFVHGGLTSDNLDEQDKISCMKIDAFMEKGISFNRYIVTGHWPTINYTHGIPCLNPIVNDEYRIIAIDGGVGLREAGQLNAFIIFNNEFSFDFVDDLPIIQLKKGQIASGGELNITWLDRFVELIEERDEFGLYKHRDTGKFILLSNDSVWDDGKGNLCNFDNGTDYNLPVNVGDFVSVVKKYNHRLLAKKDGVLGWINY